LSADERQEALDTSVWRFELSVNGVPIEMERVIHNGTGATGTSAGRSRSSSSIGSSPGDLPAGQYTLTGRWYGDVDDDDVSEVELEISRTLVVSPTVPE
jgi:hypothetical protein